MAKNEWEIRREIKEYIGKWGAPYSSWYVGIAEDPKERLFDDHGVKEKTDAWIFRYAEDVETARRIEKYFVDTLGTDGGTGGGDENTKAVYAYKKNSHTNP